jgi:hypothetical protein
MSLSVILLRQPQLTFNWVDSGSVLMGRSTTTVLEKSTTTASLSLPQPEITITMIMIR